MQKNFIKMLLKKKRENYQLIFFRDFIDIVKKKIKFSCTPFDLNSAKILQKYVDFYKIASYELNWKDLLEACAKTKKPIILSTGMATYEEVRKAYKILRKI